MFTTLGVSVSEEVESGGGKQVIARAAAVLKVLEKQRIGLSLSQISKATALPRTTVHRLVGALEAHQLVVSGEKGVKLGPALVRLAASAHTDVVAIARPFVERLGRRTRETVDVCVYRGQHAVSVDQYPSDRELRVVSDVGTAFPIHRTAHGKAMLAELSDATVVELLDNCLEKSASATMPDVDLLLKQLGSIRGNGYAVDEEEHAEGVYGLGVALKTGLSEQYSISLAVPALRFHREFDELVTALLKCKAEIESVIGDTP
jgi:DNA-binding IclR family transcriptional regulator